MTEGDIAIMHAQLDAQFPGMVPKDPEKRKTNLWLEVPYPCQMPECKELSGVQCGCCRRPVCSEHAVWTLNGIFCGDCALPDYDD